MIENEAISYAMFRALFAELVELRVVTNTPKTGSETGANSPSIKPETVGG